MLDPRAACHASCGITPEVEGYEQRQEQADHSRYTAARGAALGPQGCEERAYYGAYYGAQDQGRPQSGEPTEHYAHPASASPCCLGHFPSSVRLVHGDLRLKTLAPTTIALPFGREAKRPCGKALGGRPGTAYCLEVNRSNFLEHIFYELG